MKQRDETIDIAKAIGIIAVVLGHTEFTYSNFLYQFHLPLFFFLSGMVWNERKINDPPKYIISKIRSLYIPFILYELIFLLLHNIFCYIGFYSQVSGGKYYMYSFSQIVAIALKMITMGAGEQLAGPLWFLISSLEIVLLFPLIFIVLDKLFKKAKCKYYALILVSLILYCIGCYTNLPRMLSQSLIGMFFFACGYIYKKSSTLIPIKAPCGIIGIILIIITGLFNTVNISKLEITYKSLLILSGLVGSYSTLWLGNLIKNVRENRLGLFIKKSMTYIGRNIITILALHCISFKLIMLVEWLIYGFDYQMLGRFPSYAASSIWILLLTMGGVMLPLLFKAVLFCGRDCITKKLKIGEY